jgi:hypothetical protein
MYDKLATIAADVNQTLSLKPQGEISSEEGSFTQKIFIGDDGSEQRVNLGSTTPIFYVTFDYKLLSESDMGTLFDLYFDSAKAFGMVNSFKWSSRGDTHTYVVRFDMKLSRSGNAQSRMGAKGIRLRILGRIAD